MPSPPDCSLSRIIAVDWSGRIDLPGQRRHIWIADINGQSITLEKDRTREEASDYLIAALGESPSLAVGLDFAFSYPAWFLRNENCKSAVEFWQLVSAHGESWLRDCQPPFWGRPGKKCPADHRNRSAIAFRTADTIASKSIQPKSPFQIGGAGAVGTASLRGIPSLLRLRSTGFSIWPFEPPSSAIVCEIYPRLLTGPVNKSSAAARTAYLRHPDFRSLPPPVLRAAEHAEDAFDALVSAIRMHTHRASFSTLRQATDPDTLLEGAIWSTPPHFA